MKLFGLCLMLGTVVTLSQANPINSTLTRHIGGICELKRHNCPDLLGAFCPQCDDHGNFLPKQCSGSTGYCWCVDVITGEEIPNTRSRPGVMPVNCEMHEHCPYGWSRFEERCFIFVDNPKSWLEAEVFCQFDEANLASIHSDEENHFVQSLIRENTNNFPETWIGGNDGMHPGFWMWSDGSKFHYDNWYSDDNDEETERCLRMNYQYGLKWSATHCDDALPFVCSKST
ncbi:galactose-specific lectin nattectin [Melanotaenia boesemani]|uniref:galactose-specific lectin nattectin n=1 Tax=Melanotaenia boesemani TaxID=1250792 RepID=UPI001C047865|nr:galactose-specific lectin nattectin [Melanotaenia boesemani]XP_041840568.1 galactose-specific lectin nattectin [Melanotaenia boesemani]